MIDPKTISLESEAGFQVLFQCATIGILVINERGDIELSNPCAEKLFGYDPAELIGKPIEDLIPEDLRHKHTHHREGYFARPKARPMGLGIELYGSKKNGEVFPVEISLGHYELDGEKLAVAFITDIADRVKAKKIVAEREAWFRNMADNSPVMIWVSGIDRGFTYFNNTWLEFTGRTIEQELGNSWTVGVHPEDFESCLLTYNVAYDSRKPFITEFRLRRYDGQYRWLQVVGKPTHSSDKTFTGFIGSCSDIQDQRMMKEELERLVQQRTLELHDALDREIEMGELKSRFVSMASHEFRTPLSVVLSSAALIERYQDIGTSEKVSKHILRIKSAVSNLTTILNDFLSLDKLEAGNVEIEREVFDIAEFMREVVDDVFFLQKKGQRINFEYKGGQLVSLDQKKFRYILVNLISNSMKYSPEGTEINLHAENLDGSITIIVQDHGIGIPKEEQKHLFHKFFRAKNTGNVQGTGLGLTIVKRYVELMDGSIRFISKPGEGTSFYIEFPQS